MGKISEELVGYLFDELYEVVSACDKWGNGRLQHLTTMDSILRAIRVNTCENPSMSVCNNGENIHIVKEDVYVGECSNALVTLVRRLYSFSAETLSAFGGYVEQEISVTNADGREVGFLAVTLDDFCERYYRRIIMSVQQCLGHSRWSISTIKEMEKDGLELLKRIIEAMIQARVRGGGTAYIHGVTDDGGKEPLTLQIGWENIPLAQYSGDLVSLINDMLGLTEQSLRYFDIYVRNKMLECSRALTTDTTTQDDTKQTTPKPVDVGSAEAVVSMYESELNPISSCTLSVSTPNELLEAVTGTLDDTAPTTKDGCAPGGYNGWLESLELSKKTLTADLEKLQNKLDRINKQLEAISDNPDGCPAD